MLHLKLLSHHLPSNMLSAFSASAMSRVYDLHLTNASHTPYREVTDRSQSIWNAGGELCDVFVMFWHETVRGKTGLVGYTSNTGVIWLANTGDELFPGGGTR